MMESLQTYNQMQISDNIFQDIQIDDSEEHLQPNNG